jgi:hypothetical protein
MENGFTKSKARMRFAQIAASPKKRSATRNPISKLNLAPEKKIRTPAFYQGFSV